MSYTDAALRGGSYTDAALRGCGSYTDAALRGGKKSCRGGGKKQRSMTESSTKGLIDLANDVYSGGSKIRRKKSLKGGSIVGLILAALAARGIYKAVKKKKEKKKAAEEAKAKPKPKPTPMPSVPGGKPLPMTPDDLDDLLD